MKTMTYDQAFAVAINPRIRNISKLRRAAQRLLESGRRDDLSLVAKLRDRVVDAERKAME